jgi:hypothetical protein
MGNSPRVMWKDMAKPVSLEEHAGVPKPVMRPDLPADVSETVTVEAARSQDLLDQRQAAVNRAVGLIGNDDYQRRDANSNVGGFARYAGGINAAKCNILIGDVLASAGIDVRDPANRKLYLTTKAWGDPNAVIPGFQVLGPKDRLQPGDIVSAGRHVGMYVPGPNGEDMTISAAAPGYGDAVVHNDWGFRGDEGALTRWRYVGPSGKAAPPKWPDDLGPYNPMAGFEL